MHLSFHKYFSRSAPVFKLRRLYQTFFGLNIFVVSSLFHLMAHFCFLINPHGWNRVCLIIKKKKKNRVCEDMAPDTQRCDLSFYTRQQLQLSDDAVGGEMRMLAPSTHVCWFSLFLSLPLSHTHTHTPLASPSLPFRRLPIPPPTATNIPVLLQPPHGSPTNEPRVIEQDPSALDAGSVRFRRGLFFFFYSRAKAPTMLNPGTLRLD